MPGRSEGARWENCANRIIRTSTIEKAILLVTDPDKISQQELSRQVTARQPARPCPSLSPLVPRPLAVPLLAPRNAKHVGASCRRRRASLPAGVPSIWQAHSA